MSDRNWQDESIEKKLEARKREFRLPAFMPFFWLGLASIAGSFLADFVVLPWFWWAGLLAFSVLTWLIQLKHNQKTRTIRRFPLSLVVSALSLTAMLYQLSLPKTESGHLLAYHQRGNLTVTGVVTATPEAKSASLEVIVAAEQVEADGMIELVEGKLIFYLPLGTKIDYGDRVEIWGELEKPDEGVDFSWRDYLAHQGITTTTQYPHLKVLEGDQGNPLMAALYRLRERGNRVLIQIFPSPEDALLRGILLGDESGISPAMEDAYRRTGTSHIIAISGFNMAVLSGLVSLFFTQRLGTKRGAVATIWLLVCYSLLVGGSPSVLRAAFMGAFSVIAGVFHRKGNTLNSLGLSALGMVIVNPHLPWDFGFQFSFLATLGLALFAGPLHLRLQDWFGKRFQQEWSIAAAGMVSEFLLLTLIAQAMVFPISVWHFHQISWLFLLANPLILPLQPAVMVLGLTAMLAGILSLPLGKALAWLAWPFAALTNWIVTRLSGVPTDILILPQFNFFWVAIYYLFLFLLIFKPKPGQIGKSLLKTEYILVGLGALSLVVWMVLARAPDGRLHLHLPQGEKQAFILIESGQGQNVLIAGSAGEESLVDLISSRMPLFSSRLDTVLIPDCQRTNLTGLFAVVQKFDIENLYWICDPGKNQTSRNLYELIQDRQIPQRRLEQNQQLLGSELALTLNLENGKLQTVSIEHGEVSLLVKPADPQQDSLDKPIASTSTTGDLTYNVLVGEENGSSLQFNIEPAEIEQKVHIPWYEIVSNGRNLSFLLP